ncbi:Ribosome-releasing factor 2 mitochondrial [Meyerozyma sp. JA9]|nr:Ribosome-releasing factor 2 mitochondrial [Meyerozyma sp. JA9]
MFSINAKTRIPIWVSFMAKRTFSKSTRHLSEPKLNQVSSLHTRNIGIIAHIDAGKTTTTERMLYYSGKTTTMGDVDQGDTVTDYLPSERSRGITIQSAAISIPWNNNKINIIDTPGHADFTFEVIRSLRVLDGCVTILDAVAGVEAQTEKVWKQAQTLKIPRIAFVNKMDRPGAGFSRTVKEIVQKLQTKVVLCNIPYFEMVKDDAVFVGVIDILHNKILKWNIDEDPNGRNISVVDLQEAKESNKEAYMEALKCRESMVETLGGIEETVVDAFLEYDEDYMKIPSSVLKSAIRKACISNQVTPVFCGSAFRKIAVQPLLDGVVDYLPSPLETPVPEITVSTSKVSKKQKQKKNSNLTSVPVEMNPNKGLIVNKDPKLTVALAFKVMTHATRGVMTFFRVYSGSLASNTTVVNTRTGKKLNLNKVLLMHGDTPEPVSQISSGNIGVITGTENDVITGDTLVSHGPVKRNFTDVETSIKLLPIEIPPPLFNSSIEPLTAGDARYMNECIDTLIREDPSLSVNVDEELGQTILSGMGELHLEIVRDRLINDMKAKIRLRNVAVSFKETVSKPSLEVVKVGKNDGLVKVEVSLEAIDGPAEEATHSDENGSILLETDNNIVILPPEAAASQIGESLSERRWKSEHSLEELNDIILQGITTGLQLGGPILGLPLHSVVVRVTHWDFPVEGKEVSASVLLEASRQVVREALNKLPEASFCILEPIMLTRVYVDSGTMGEVVHDLSHRCSAHITSIEDESENMDSNAWANEEAENLYLPPDYTMKSGNNAVNFTNKKVIVAETPLRDMVGYLSKLRSITQGRGVFDMTYLGMRRAIRPVLLDS